MRFEVYNLNSDESIMLLELLQAFFTSFAVLKLRPLPPALLADEEVRHFANHHEGVAVYGATVGEHDLVFANNTSTTELAHDFIHSDISAVHTTDIAVVAL